jgi:branched-chain amino acid aminotransferase
MNAVVNINGQLVDERHATISVFDHGFLYGEGVYETLRTYNRRPFLLERHLRRLRRSAERIRLPLPWSDEQLGARMAETLAATSFDEAYIRLLVTRGPGDLTYDPRACEAPSVVIIVRRHVEPPAEAFEQGVPIILSSVIRNHPAALDPLIKSNNLLNNALAMQQAIDRGAYEALMCNHRGELAECSQSNFFLVRGGVLLTPALDCGLLEGITRNFVLELAHELGIPAQETVLLPRDLATAEEAFLTSTTREVLPVVRVDDRPIGRGRPGPISRRLLEAYRRRAREITSQPQVLAR